MMKGVDAYALAIGVVECLEFHNVGVPDNAHNLKFTILKQSGQYCDVSTCGGRTLNRLSCRTRLMAASSPLGESLV
jgi:hypothetical protein